MTSPGAPIESQGRLGQAVVERLRGLAVSYPDPRSAVMAALYAAQDELGYVTAAAMGQIAEILGMDVGYVEGIATFYTLYFTQPVGKHQFSICQTLSCALRGSDRLMEHTLERLGLEESGQTSADGLFTALEVECLGCCEYAPVMRLDNRFHYDLTTEMIDQLIDERRGQSS